MLPTERRNKIKEALTLQGNVTVKRLAQEFQVTMETIRNDLDHLCKQDFEIIKVHGGAYLSQNSVQGIPMMLRENIMLEEKIRMAEAAVNLFTDGDSIILDTSSTAMYVAKKIIEKKLRVVILTNSLPITNLLSSHPQVKIITLGGNYNHTLKSFIGPMPIQALSNYHADFSIISPTKLSMEQGLSDDNQDIAQIRMFMLTNSKRGILLVDNTKFDCSELFNIADFDQIDQVITDEALDDRWIDFFKLRDITLTIV